MMKVEIKSKYAYDFSIIAVLTNNSGPDTVTVLHENLDTMEDVIPLMDNMPAEPDTTYYVTVAYSSLP